MNEFIQVTNEENNRTSQILQLHLRAKLVAISLIICHPWGSNRYFIAEIPKNLEIYHNPEFQRLIKKMSIKISSQSYLF